EVSRLQTWSACWQFVQTPSRKAMFSFLISRGLLMAHTGFFVALIAALLVSTTAQAADDDARALIARSIQAIGGDAKAAKLQAATFTETGKYYGQGDGLPYTGKYAVQYPGQFRMEIEGVFTIVVDGDKGWLSSMGNVQAMTDEQLGAQQND